MSKKLIIFLPLSCIICVYVYLLIFNEKHYPQGVILIGIDGAEWEIINSMIKEGLLPNFAGIKKEGVYGKIVSIPMKESKYPTNYLSPAIWTSIATGTVPSKHGITDWNINGQFASPMNRKSPAMWNILSYYKKRVAVIGWYATYPAESINGYLVSSRLGVWGYEASLKIPIEKYNWLDEKLYKRIVYPPNFINEIKENIFNEKLHLKSFIKKNVVDIDCQLYKEEQANFFLPIVLWQDEIYFRILKYLFGKERFQMIAVYFDGIDHIQHHFWRYNLGEYDDIRGTFYKDCEKVDVVKNYYILMDKRIGEIYKGLKGNYAIMIVSDHGGMTYPYYSKKFTHSGHSVFFAAGKGIRKGKKLKYPNYSVLDVLPTILYMLNVPISKDMDGQVMEDIFDYGVRREAKIVKKYPHEIGENKFDDSYGDKFEEYIEKLRALGYVQ